MSVAIFFKAVAEDEVLGVCYFKLIHFLHVAGAAQ